MARARVEKQHRTTPGIASAEMLWDDFRALDAKETLRTTYDIEQLILMQTVEGHSHEGHGLFYGQKYPDTTIDDIAKALRLSPSDVKMERQRLIDDIRIFAERIASGEDLKYAITEEGAPILGISYFRSLPIDGKGVLQGLYMGGLRDQADIRKDAQDKFGIKIGFGKGYYIDRHVMQRMGLNGEILSQQGHEHDIDSFRTAGLIVDRPDDNDIQYMYIRHQAGPGASDDAAIVIAGLLYGISAAVGCFFADAIDTLEKYVPEAKDQDAFVSKLIADSGFDIGLGREDSVDLAYLAAAIGYGVPDSSLRKMLAVDRKIDQCALESHFLYVQKKPYSIQKLDHGQCTNEEFYQWVEARVGEYRK